MLTMQFRTIGVMGGMGPAATADFYRRIVECTPAECDQDHLHVLIDSRPGVPDRTAFLLGDGEDPTPHLLTMARGLERAGAELLVMPCNTAGAFAGAIAGAVSIPLVDWIGQTAAEVVSRRPGLRRIGVLATAGTIRLGLYHDAFAGHGVEVLVPAAVDHERVMEVIYAVKGASGGMNALDREREALAGVARTLADAGAGAVLLACTELSVLCAHHPLASEVPVSDPSQIIAEYVVRVARSTTETDVVASLVDAPAAPS